MKKLISLSLSLVMLAVVLTSCYPAIINTKMDLNSDGSGTRTFIAEILKDGQPNPDTPSDPAKNVTGMFTDPGYFPSGMQAVVDYLNTVKPAAVSAITMEDKTDRYVMTFTMSFTSISDFNTKMKTIITPADWTTYALEDSTFVKVDAGNNKSNITYTEDLSLVNLSTTWMSYALWNSPVAQKVFDKAYAQGQYNWEKHYNDETALQYAMFFTNDVTIKIGTLEHLFPKNSEAISFTALVNNPVTPTVAPTKAPTNVPTVAPTDDTNPVTGDVSGGFGVLAVIIIVAASSMLFVLRRNLQN